MVIALLLIYGIVSFAMLMTLIESGPEETLSTAEHCAIIIAWPILLVVYTVVGTVTLLDKIIFK